jgi:hypothetical protein
MFLCRESLVNSVQLMHSQYSARPERMLKDCRLIPSFRYEIRSTSVGAEFMGLAPLISARFDFRPRVFRA